MRLTPSIWIPEECMLKVKLCYEFMKTSSVHCVKRQPLYLALLYRCMQTTGILSALSLSMFEGPLDT